MVPTEFTVQSSQGFYKDIIYYECNGVALTQEVTCTHVYAYVHAACMHAYVDVVEGYPIGECICIAMFIQRDVTCVYVRMHASVDRCDYEWCP